MPDHTKDRAIDALARRQHGAFSTKQTTRLGFSTKERRSRLRSGRWVRLLHSDVFAVASAPATWERQCAAATLSVPTAGLWGPTAAAIHDFPGAPRAAIEVVTHHGATNRSPFGKVHQSRTVHRFTLVDGIRAVSQADATIQVARAHDVESLGSIVDELHRRRKRYLDELHDAALAVACSRLPGAATLRGVLGARGPGHVPPESELNRVFHEFLLGLPLPDLELEATPWWVEPGRQRVDALVEPWRLIVEADGRDFHTRVADFERDRERDAVALAHGYETLRFTWHKLTVDQRWCRTMLLAVGAHRSSLPEPRVGLLVGDRSG
jgi:hypothetical protein